MSGNPTGSNVVPMPHAQAPATAPPQMPTPMPGMWGGGGSLPWGPGCCPPGGMDALLKCYCDVQAATAFICSVMVQCVQTNPAVVQAIIAAIKASGSSLPLTGVTNGSDAQPGQVGEFVTFQLGMPYTGAVGQVISFSMGVLQPGDWDVWYTASATGLTTSIAAEINPLPVGFVNSLFASLDPGSAAGEASVLVSSTTRALISVPSLVVIQMSLNWVAATTPGTANVYFVARRRR